MTDQLERRMDATERRLDAMADFGDRNRRDIRQETERSKERHAEVMAALATITGALFGNGDTEKSIAHRLAIGERRADASERWLRGLTIAIGIMIAAILYLYIV